MADKRGKILPEWAIFCIVLCSVVPTIQPIQCCRRSQYGKYENNETQLKVKKTKMPPLNIFICLWPVFKFWEFMEQKRNVGCCIFHKDVKRIFKSMTHSCRRHETQLRCMSHRCKKSPYGWSHNVGLWRRATVQWKSCFALKYQAIYSRLVWVVNTSFDML